MPVFELKRFDRNITACIGTFSIHVFCVIPKHSNVHIRFSFLIFSEEYIGQLGNHGRPVFPRNTESTNRPVRLSVDAIIRMIDFGSFFVSIMLNHEALFNPIFHDALGFLVHFFGRSLYRMNFLNGLNQANQFIGLKRRNQRGSNSPKVTWQSKTE